MTLFLIVVTGLVSILAFNRPEIYDKFRFNAFLIRHDKAWHRFLTYGLIHADWMHLFVNLFVLYSFGEIVELFYRQMFGLKGSLYYLLLYVGGLAFSTLWDYGRQKENVYYNAVGASGAVSAIVFASILLYPQGRIFLFFIPIGIPAPIFGILYLIYSAVMAARGKGNVGHSAHFWGAVFGLAFTLALNPATGTHFFHAVFG
ncbi:MAG: rhomboid family intramembrane serine protease [Bacteroidales bacterium]